MQHDDMAYFLDILIAANKETDYVRALTFS